MITNDPAPNFAGPCVWGKANKNDFSCQSIVWMKDKGFTDYEECLEIGKRNYILESCFIIVEYSKYHLSISEFTF